MNFAKLLFLFLSLNCSLGFSKQKTPEHIIYAHQIKRKFIQEMEQKYGWVCIGSGGSMPNQVEYISVEFALKRRATIEEARVLEVLAVERFAAMLNANEQIRPYLCEFPFPSHRAEVGFSFYAPYGDPFADGTVTNSSQINGKLVFYSEDPETGNFIPLLKEPYVEAKKIVQCSSEQGPFVHREKPHEPIIDAIFMTYLKEMAKEYRLEGERIGGKLTEGVEEVVARLIYFHPTRIDKARELQVIATEKLLDAINSNEKLRPYIKNYPLSLDKVKVSVLFRKSNYFSYFDGTLDSVCRQGDKVSYLMQPDYDEDVLCLVVPTELTVFATESYQDCVKRIQKSSRGKKLRIKWRE